jgi:catechol 2,3-dioxygenase-like lactoylglutathione lyase family enzyme
VPLTSGINHVALVTADLDRFVEFYTSVFDGKAFAALTEGPVRHALIDLGGGMALHPFEFAGRPEEGPFGEMFARGHLDHVSLNVADEETFEMLRRRLVECGASDGTMTDFGAVRTVAYRDPDGWWGEIAIWTGGEPVPLNEAEVTEADF